MPVRKATEADLDRILAIERQSFPHPWSKPFLQRLLNEALVLVYEQQGWVIGFLIAELERSPDVAAPVGHLLDLAVTPDCRRAGVATKLLRKFSHLCQRVSATRIYLEVRVSNRVAIRFYEKNGFIITRRLARAYGDGQDGYLMERRLKESLQGQP